MRRTIAVVVVAKREAVLSLPVGAADAALEALGEGVRVERCAAADGDVLAAHYIEISLLSFVEAKYNVKLSLAVR